MINEKLDEFFDIKDKRKYLNTTTITFKDGRLVKHWFNNHKKEIFESDNPKCKIIKREYEEYKASYSTVSEFKSYHVTEAHYNKCKQFINYKGDDKFKYKSDACFKDGINMFEWFSENEIKILSSTNEYCIEIAREYYKYKEKQKNKKIFDKNKKKYIFLKQKGFDKYKKESNLRFFDNELMSSWFYRNLDSMQNSNNKIYEEILLDFEFYLNFIKLEEEFKDCDDLNKFDEYSNLKFSTGAYMGPWWEFYKKLILSQNDALDNEIKEQLKRYTDNESGLIKKI